jgi:ATP-binding cassette subfamily C (CFTR/MRP) protein 4
MNRYSRDLGIIDDLLPPTAFDAIELLVNSIAIVILCTLMDYWILIPSFVLFIIFILIRRFFMETARRLKKVEGIARSPVLSHLSTSLYGLTTIRSFGTQSNFIEKFDSLQDKHTSAYFLFLCSTRWFGVVLDNLCVVYIIALTILLVMTISDRTGSEVGLSISQALMLTGGFQWGVRQNAEVETQMTSVERVVEFSNLEKEDDIETKPPEGLK